MSTETTTAPAASGMYPTITELLARVMADVTHVGKDGYNKQQSYNFRGIDAVVNAVGPAFRAHGIVPKPILKKVTYEDILVGGNRTPMTRCTVEVKYRFKGPGGDYEDVTVPGEAFDSGDKGTAKAMSVAYRIALLQLLALPTHEPDPDESSYERAPAAVTDQRWLAAVRQRIAAASDHDALNVIGADIGSHADAGQLSIADGNRLRGEFDARWTALTPAAPAGNGWDSAPSQTAAEAPDGPADRHRGPVEDQWNTATGQPLPAPAPGTPSATEQQIGEIVRLLGVKRGVYNGHCAGAVSQLVHRQVANPKTLSQAEARSIIETLTAEPDRTATAPETAPAGVAPVGTPDNPRHTASQMKMIQATLTERGITNPQAKRDLISRILGVQIERVRDLSKDQASRVVDFFSTGEVPPPTAPTPEQPDEGFTEFDALDAMIGAVDSDQTRAELEQAITVEVGRGTITASDAGILRERLAAHVAQAKAGV